MTLNIPKLRFKGFDGEFDGKKLSDVFVFFRGKGISKEDIIKDGVNKCIRYGELYTEYSEIINNVKSKTNILEEDSLLSKKGDVLIPSSGETAIDISTVSCVKLDNILLGGDLNVMRPNDGQDGNFYSYYLSSAKKISIAKIAQGNSVVHLYSSHLKNLKINVPLLPEQQKIADFLESANCWIKNLKQQKKSIEIYKKGMMQKIFAQEIRFKDENGKSFPEWEEEKLGKYLIQYHEKSTENDQYPVLTSSQRGIFFQKDYFNGDDVSSKDTTGYNVVPRDFFTYRHMSDTLIFKFNINTIVDKGIVSTLYPVFKTNGINNYFLLIKLNNGDEFKKYAILQKQGGSRTYVYYSKLIDLKIKIPSLKEQQKIVDFLTSIDNLINSKQQQIAKAEEWKRGLMQGLFV